MNLKVHATSIEVRFDTQYIGNGGLESLDQLGISIWVQLKNLKGGLKKSWVLLSLDMGCLVFQVNRIVSSRLAEIVFEFEDIMVIYNGTFLRLKKRECYLYNISRNPNPWKERKDVASLLLWTSIVSNHVKSYYLVFDICLMICICNVISVNRMYSTAPNAFFLFTMKCRNNIFHALENVIFRCPKHMVLIKR